jgi:hypothetical protein
VFFWFIGTAWLAVWLVFRDSRFDFRVLALGAVLPDLVDLPLGGARVLHSVTASVGLMMMVMVATIGRRAPRKRWLALPIGTFFHLVFDGAWNSTRVFWWPFTGVSWPDAELPSLSRGALSALLEVVGIAIIIWFVRMAGLDRPARRREFLRTGTLHAAPTARRVGTC